MKDFVEESAIKAVEGNKTELVNFLKTLPFKDGESFIITKPNDHEPADYLKEFKVRVDLNLYVHNDGDMVFRIIFLFKENGTVEVYYRIYRLVRCKLTDKEVIFVVNGQFYKYGVTAEGSLGLVTENNLNDEISAPFLTFEKWQSGCVWLEKVVRIREIYS